MARICKSTVTILLIAACAGAYGQQKQTLRAYLENLNAKAAAGQPLPKMAYEGPYADTTTAPLAEIVDAGPALRESLMHETSTQYGVMLLAALSLRPDADKVLRESQEAMEAVLARDSMWSTPLCLPYMRLVQRDHIFTGAPALEAYLERPGAQASGGGRCFAEVLLWMQPIQPDADAAVAKFIRRRDLNGIDLGAMTNAVAHTHTSSPEVVKAIVELIHNAQINKYFMQEMGEEPQAVRDGVRRELERTVQDSSASEASRPEAKRFLDMFDRTTKVPNADR